MLISGLDRVLFDFSPREADRADRTESWTSNGMVLLACTANILPKITHPSSPGLQRNKVVGDQISLIMFFYMV